MLVLVKAIEPLCTRQIREVQLDDKVNKTDDGKTNKPKKKGISDSKVGYTLINASGSGKSGRLTNADIEAMSAAAMAAIEPIQKWLRGEGPKPGGGMVRNK